MNYIEDIPICGAPEQGALDQIKAIRSTVEYAALMADSHQGYVCPIGGVVASQELLSLAGVGYDICCGNKAVRLNSDTAKVREWIAAIMDKVATEISFGVGRVNTWQVEDEMFDLSIWDELPALQQRDKRGRALKHLAAEQLGTVGSGNHYVNVMVDEQDRTWVAVHFGSRGLGHRVATWFLEAAGGTDQIHGRHIQLHFRSDLGEQYLKCLELASRYAYRGRDLVVERVADIVGGDAVESIHVNHNGIWRESHNGLDYFVARKGSTPCWPGQQCFVGGSMGDDSVILEGVESDLSKALFYSTVHGAGRVMSRTKATGRKGFGRKQKIGEAAISHEDMYGWINAKGVTLRGADVDEAPQAYKRLSEVLPEQGDTIRVLHTLSPIGVAMAGNDVFDPYKD